MDLHIGNEDLALRVRRGDIRAVARLISGLENGDVLAARASGLLGPGQFRGSAHVVGITGPPGSGKSTLTDKLISAFRKRGARVGVLAVDPSSPFTGGAILGDRLRMQHHATDEGVFIRSLASRGRLGGLSRATAGAARVLAAAGFDWIIIETVGVGQSEVDIVKLADTVLLVSVPGLGDDIQVIKAGIMEIGDIFVVNKADRDGAERVVRELSAMLETAAALAMSRGAACEDQAASLATRLASHGGHHGVFLAPGGFPPPRGPDGHPILPPILKTVAETGEGCEGLADAILAHRERLAASGELEARRREGLKAELRGLLEYRIAQALERGEGHGLEKLLVDRIRSGDTDMYEAVDELFAALAKGGIA